MTVAVELTAAQEAQLEFVRRFAPDMERADPAELLRYALGTTYHGLRYERAKSLEKAPAPGSVRGSERRRS